MAISYPLSLPSGNYETGVTIRITDVVGVQTSPISLGQTVYDWGGDMLTADVELRSMSRAEAEQWVAFLWALRGRRGTFLMGDSLNRTPQGTWAGSPVVDGAHAAGVRTVALRGLSAAATGKAGDWLQFGSGSTAELHKVLQDFTADGSGDASVELGPSIRAALSDGAALVTSSPVGRWRLATNTREYSIGLAQRYGIAFSCVEDLSG